MNYEVGDKVYYKNILFIMDAVILEIDNSEDHNHHIEYTDFNENKHEVWVNKECLVGFKKGTEKYLEQEVLSLLNVYSKEEILECAAKINA